MIGYKLLITMLKVSPNSTINQLFKKLKLNVLLFENKMMIFIICWKPMDLKKIANHAINLLLSYKFQT